LQECGPGSRQIVFAPAGQVIPACRLQWSGGCLRRCRRHPGSRGTNRTGAWRSGAASGEQCGGERARGGGDNLSIYWKKATDPDPIDGTAPNLTNNFIRMMSWAATNLTITKQPVAQDVFEGLDAVFTVEAATDAEVTPVYQWQRNQVDMPGRTTATLSMTPPLTDNGAKYRCVITLAPSSLSVTSAEVTLTVRASVFINGLVKQEIWGPNNTTYTRAGVESGNQGPATSKGYLSMFDTPDFADNYVQRLSTWFRPPQNGNYVFLISSDDDSDLFVSTDDDPVNKRLVAQQTGWNANREWSSATGQRSSASFSPDGGATTPFASGIPMNTSQTSSDGATATISPRSNSRPQTRGLCDWNWARKDLAKERGTMTS